MFSAFYCVDPLIDKEHYCMLSLFTEQGNPVIMD